MESEEIGQNRWNTVVTLACTRLWFDSLDLGFSLVT